MPFGQLFRWITIANFVQRKIAAFGDFDRAIDNSGIVVKKSAKARGGFSAYSALGFNFLPQEATGMPWRIAVSTSCSRRRAGVW